MAKRPTVPKFGNWENEVNAPYTTYFNEARKGKAGGKMINPNDPQENPEMFANQTQPPPVPQTQPEEPVHKPPVPPTHDHQVNRLEDHPAPTDNPTRRNSGGPANQRGGQPVATGRPVRPSVGSDHSFDRSPLHDHRVNREEDHPAPNDNPTRRNSGGPAHQRGGQPAVTGRPVKHSVGSDRSFDRSPLHPHYQAKIVGKGDGSPAWEGKNSYDSSHGTPGRSRMKPNRVDDSPDNGAAVPRFGGWDDNNPSSGENYTHIFNKVREERTGSPMVSGPDARPNYNIPRNRKTGDKQCCCFPWSK